MAALTVQNIVNAGTKPNFALNTPTASDTASVGDGTDTILIYKNGSGASITVTVAVPGQTSYGVAYPPQAIVVAAAGEAWIPLRKAFDDGTGKCTVTTSSQTSLTVALVRHQ